MASGDRRIVSLIPSATEIVAFLGLTDALVGRSHECDYPLDVQSLPICTAVKFNPEGGSLEIHDRVTNLLQSALSVYQVKTDVLQKLRPTHILTQAQCEVCAVSLAEVEQAVAELVDSHPQIISLQPNRLADVWADLERVGKALGVSAVEGIMALEQRVSACSSQAQALTATCPTIACIEWIEPLMAAGNWIPELVQLAGGINLFGAIGQHSPWLQWEDLIAANPDVIVVMPCGFDLDRTRQEAALHLMQRPQWLNLQAVKTGRVYLTDGNQYFNRPGPRLVDSLEILAEIFYPDRIHYGFQGKGWQSLTQ